MGGNTILDSEIFKLTFFPINRFALCIDGEVTDKLIHNRIILTWQSQYFSDAFKHNIDFKTLEKYPTFIILNVI